MMKCINVCVLLVIACTAFSGAKQLPSYIQKCKRADPVERNKCIMERVEDVKPHLIEGIPELKLPRIDPLRIPKLEAHIGSNAALQFTLIFMDVDFYGVKNFQVKELNLDLSENGNLFIHVYIPYLKAQAKYVTKGKISLFELDTTGMASLNMTEINAKSNGKLAVVSRNGKEYAQFAENRELEVNYDSISLYFDDLIKNNKELTEQTNKAINDNYDTVAKEIDYLIQEGVQSVISGIIQAFIDEYSLDELFE